MLYYVGKDLARWIDQCVEFADHNREHLPSGITFQSFAAMLVQDAPANIQEKLRKWGVADFKSIFTRALGLQYVFAAAPARELLCDDFLRNYFKFADQMFAVKQGEREFTPLAASDFQFELYSSGEYSGCWKRFGASRALSDGFDDADVSLQQIVHELIEGDALLLGLRG